MPVNSRTVLSTGSSRGIGFAIARRFASEGFNVVLTCDLDLENLEKAVSELKKTNPNVAGIPADISSFEQTRELFDKIKSIFGDVDVLVNNAGIAHFGLFQDMKPSEWERLFQVNLFGAFNCSRLAIPAMVANKRGSIINISSIWGESGASCEAAYAASKGALNSFSKSLAKELGPSGVRVNAISCGAMITDMNSRLNEEEKADFIERIPLMRFGEASEAASLACFLASDEASYITGQIISIDGGFSG
jgi:3-oxoacyl-[acyl-carrier protein] reductase